MVVKEVNPDGETTKLSFDDPHGVTHVRATAALTYEHIITLIADRTRLAPHTVADILDRNAFHKPYLVDYANKTPSLVAFLVQTLIAQTHAPP